MAVGGPSDGSPTKQLAHLYRELDADAIRQRSWEHTSALEVFYRLGRLRAIAALLRDRGIVLGGASILDIGCGYGRSLIDLLVLGAEPQRLAGVDVLEDRVDRARSVLSNADLRVGDATSLPWPDDTFDVVTQFTALSSIADARWRMAAANQMRRVLKPNGVIVSWDLVRRFGDSPAGLGRGELVRLFNPTSMDTRRTGLDPRLASRLTGRFERVAMALETASLRPSHLAVAMAFEGFE
jgi:SAM-dependent methyltransferase